MEIYDYATSGGKNLITSYIEDLPNSEKLAIYDIRAEIERNGLDALEKLSTRQLRDKLWEIKVSQTRMMYIVGGKNEITFINICKKQKGKAEKHEIDKAIDRAQREGLI